MAFRLVLTAAVVIGGIIETSQGNPRIVIDGPSNQIQVYDSTGTLVGVIGGATGQILSIGATSFTSIDGGIVHFGQVVGGTPQTTEQGTLEWTTTGAVRRLRITGPIGTGAALSDAARLILQCGDPAAPSGSGTNPIVFVTDGSSATQTDLQISGAALKAGELWQAPAYSANWAGTTNFNGTANWKTLQYRRDAEDNVWVVGAFTAAAGAAAGVVQLPVGYRPGAGNQHGLPCQRNNAGAVTYGMAVITGAGNLNILATNGLGIVAGNEYLVNGRFPLGNLG